jgi:ribosome-interacting GTPase 1
MGILEKIKDIEDEMARTQKNKATEYHLGQLKARLAKLRTELQAPASKVGLRPDCRLPKKAYKRDLKWSVSCPEPYAS